MRHTQIAWTGSYVVLQVTYLFIYFLFKTFYYYFKLFMHLCFNYLSLISLLLLSYFCLTFSIQIKSACFCLFICLTYKPVSKCPCVFKPASKGLWVQYISLCVNSTCLSINMCTFTIWSPRMLWVVSLTFSGLSSQRLRGQLFLYNGHCESIMAAVNGSGFCASCWHLQWVEIIQLSQWSFIESERRDGWSPVF